MSDAMLTPEDRSALLMAMRNAGPAAPPTAQVQLINGPDPVDTRAELKAIAAAVQAIVKCTQESAAYHGKVIADLTNAVGQIAKGMAQTQAALDRIAKLKIEAPEIEVEAPDFGPIAKEMAANTAALKQVAAVLNRDQMFLFDDRDQIIGATRKPLDS